MVRDSLLFSDELLAELQTTTPEPLLDVLAIVTLLGDLEVYIVVLTVYYWTAGRERGLPLLAVGLTVALVVPGLKELFGLPRPPAELHLVDAEHFGLPSGHAAGPLAIYGALLYSVDVLTRRQKLALGFVLVSSIALSRLFLGVHYPADTIAGLALGGALLGIFVVYAELDTGRTLAAGAAVSLPFVAVALVTPGALTPLGRDEILFATGGFVAVGLGWLGSRQLGSPSAIDLRTPAGAAAVVVGLAVVFGGYALASDLTGTALALAAVALTGFVVVYLDVVDLLRRSVA